MISNLHPKLLISETAGARCPLSVGAGAAGVGIRHQPHSARSCELALHAVGTAGVQRRGRARVRGHTISP